MKKKQKTTKPKKPHHQRLHTQTTSLFKKQKNVMTIQTKDKFETQIVRQKIILKRMQLQKLLLKIKDKLQMRLEKLLTSANEKNDAAKFLEINSFRTLKIERNQLVERFSQIIQGFQCLYSKLHNQQKVKEKIYLKGEEDFLLFFKHLFGKPYKLCNLPHFRKILQIVWHINILPNFDQIKIIENLLLWIHGIQMPINPAAIHLQKMVFQKSHQIKKYTSFLSNNIIYCNINNADCLGLTPLLLAGHLNKANSFQFLIKCGAKPFLCPLIIEKSNKFYLCNKKIQKQKYICQKTFPMQQRLQYNCLQIFLVNKQYQMIADLLAWQETYKIKQLKKNRKVILEKLLQIPDCSFQLDWKTMKKFISFKELPKDSIFIRKKKGYLRIDYHIKEIQKFSPVGYYTILLKASEQKMQYYLVDHKLKKIVNLMREIDYEKLKTRYDQFVQFGCLEELKCSKFKMLEKGQTIQYTQISSDFYFQNVDKANIYKFQDYNSYQKQLVESEMFDYEEIQKSQINCVLKQKFMKIPPKVKSKTVKSSNTFSIEWQHSQKLKISHFLQIIDLLDFKSSLFIKIKATLNLIIEDYQQNPSSQFNSGLRIPKKIVVSGPINTNDISLQIQIKNLIYTTEKYVDDSIFETDYCTQNMGYMNQGTQLQSLQETMIMDESYSINMSQFLGKTEQLLQKQNQEANRRFQELLNQQINQNSQDQQDYQDIVSY